MKIPIYLLWNISDKNNLGISMKNAKKLIKEFVECGGFLINIGGEPLIRKDIKELIKLSTSKGLITTLRISGKYLNYKIAKELKNSNLRAILITLFSLDKDKNDFLLGKDAYDNAIRALKICNEVGMDTEIMTIITKENVMELEKMIKLSINLNVKVFIIQRAVILKAWKKRYTDFSQKEYKNLLTKISNLSEKYSKEIIITISHCPFKVLLSKRIEMSRVLDSYGGCSAAFVSLSILPNGDVIPCLPLPLKAGNILQDGIRNIWENSNLFNNLRDREKLKGKCGRCKYKMVCGGCRAEAYYTMNEIMESDPSCWL